MSYSGVVKRLLYPIFHLLIVVCTDISDFYVKAKTRDERIKKYIVEVKPEKQCQAPKRPKRQTKNYITEVRTFGVNQAKWKAAIEYCKDRNMEFMILTEKHLKV